MTSALLLLQPLESSLVVLALPMVRWRVPATLVFAGVLGVAMFKNLDNPGAFSDKRFKMDDS